MSLRKIDAPAVIIKNGGGLEFQHIPFCIFPWSPFSFPALKNYRNDLRFIYRKWLIDFNPFSDTFPPTEQHIWERLR